MIIYTLFVLLLFLLKAGSEFALIVLAYLAYKVAYYYIPKSESLLTRLKRASKAF